MIIKDGINFSDYWRNKLGGEFRHKVLDLIGKYAEKIGEVKDQGNNSYEAVLDISDVKDTIFPLGVSCNMTTRETRLIAKIISRGKVTDDGYVTENVSLFDIQNNEIDNNDICIDSLLFMLDFLDPKKSSD